MQVYGEGLSLAVSEDSEDSEDSEFWYIIPVAGVGLVLLIFVLVKNFGRLRKKEKR